MEQLTREQAIAYHDAGEWIKLNAKERFSFQIEQDCLCMPFSEFQMAANVALGRPVYTHEFADRDGLRAEFEGKVSAPSLAEIVGKLPGEKVAVMWYRNEPKTEDASSSIYQDSKGQG